MPTSPAAACPIAFAWIVGTQVLTRAAKGDRKTGPGPRTLFNSRGMLRGRSVSENRIPLGFSTPTSPATHPLRKPGATGRLRVQFSRPVSNTAYQTMATSDTTDRFDRAVTLGNDRCLLRPRPGPPPTGTGKHFHPPDRLRHMLML